MDDLSLVGVHDDGEHLLLTTPSGQRYRLKVDEAVRAAVRRDRARLSQIQLEAEGRLRPREIQTRIRSGESAEDVAASAGLSLEHVQRYEGPVLAERAYVADQARGVRVRRDPGSGPSTLDDVVRERLSHRDVDLDDLRWDAWRLDEGSWTIALDYEAGGRVRSARWTYNQAVRHVLAQDDESRLLTEDEPPPAAGGPTVPQRRLAPVRDQVFDVDAATRQEEAAVDLLDTLRERRGRRNRPLTEEEEIGGAPDPVREAIDSLLSRAEVTRAEVTRAAEANRPDGGRKPLTEPVTGRTRVVEQHEHEVLVLPDAEAAHEDDEPPVEEPAARSSRPGGRRPRRASVPSWDDIVFGQRRD